MDLINIGDNNPINVHLNKFSELVSGLTIPMTTRNIDDRDWPTQIAEAVSLDAYNNCKSNPDYKPPKINAIFGETPEGSYILDSLKYLNYDRYYTSAYMPLGCVGWHTDKDLPGWAMMLSYTLGEGAVFRWMENEELHEGHDPQGWAIRVGKMILEDSFFWHSVSTPVPRWTVILMWDTEQAWIQACDQLRARSSSHLEQV